MDFYISFDRWRFVLLGDRLSATLSVLFECSVYLSVTLVYCGRTFGWIMMPLGMEVGFGPGHIVLDGDQLSSPTLGRTPVLGR